MKKYSNLVAFLQAMRALFLAKDFLLIRESAIQHEILAIISNSTHF